LFASAAYAFPDPDGSGHQQPFAELGPWSIPGRNCRTTRRPAFCGRPQKAGKNEEDRGNPAFFHATFAAAGDFFSPRWTSSMDFEKLVIAVGALPLFDKWAWGAVLVAASRYVPKFGARRVLSANSSLRRRHPYRSKEASPVSPSLPVRPARAAD